MSNFKTEQEAFWAGNFGSEYISRNKSQHYLAANLNFFGKILAKTNGIKSILEFGPNIGMNLKAIDLLLPEVDFAGVEINAHAFDILQTEFPKGSFVNQSIAEFEATKVYDLCMVKGVLIHLNPELLETSNQQVSP